MKNLKKIALIFAVVICFAVCFFAVEASAATYGDLTYTVSDGEVTITDCDTSASGEIEIPAEIDGYPVTSIGSYAFKECSKLTSVTISNSVTSIGSDAFYYCSGLTNINIPDSVTSIGSYAFYKCSSLTSINIPDSVTSIGSDAFYYCSGLTNINIPDSVTSIGGSTFSNCSGLTSVAIPDSVTSIGEWAFHNCSGLTSITIPDSVTSIGSYAFCDCSGFTNINIPDSVTSIGDYAFADCDSLGRVFITDIDAWCRISFSNYSSNPLYYAKKLYLNGELIRNITIPNDVTELNCTFCNCLSLVSAAIPDSVTIIGDSVFYGCSGLTSIDIPDSVTSIEDGAFYKCSKLTSITIPDKVTSIGDYAFAYCSGLTSITIPDSVSSIGERAFYSCQYINDIIIPDSVTSIGVYAFYYTYPKKIAVLNKELDSINLINSLNSYTTIYAYNNYDNKELAEEKSITWVELSDFDCENENHCLSFYDSFTVSSTCTVEGSKTTKCLICNKEITETISKVDHTKSKAIKENERAATCSTEGSYDSVVYCSVCDAELSRETQTIPATGHKSDEGTTTKAPTCTSDGEKVYKCTVCGEVVNTETIPATGHTVVIDKTVPATCTAEGKTEGSHCSVCNTVITSQTVIPKIAHTSDKGTVTKVATCTAKGTKTYKCTVCGTVIKTSTIKATGHTTVVLPAVVATVKQSGLTAGSKCSVCGKVLKAQTMTLAQATGLKSTAVSSTSISLKWTAINGAKYYKLEQYNASTKKWTVIKTTTATSYTVNKLGAGTSYKFRVTALDSTKKIAGKASAVLTVSTLCVAPPFSLTSTKSKTATVTVTKLTGAYTYTIYKSTDNKSWSKVAKTDNTTYNLTGLTAGKKIYIKIVGNYSNGKVSDYSSVKSVTVKK